MTTEPIAIVAVAVHTAGGHDTAGFVDAMFSGTARPAILHSGNPVLDAFREAVTAVSLLPTRTTVFSGRGHGARQELSGFGFAIADDEAPTTAGLVIAVRTLRSGESDAAVVVSQELDTAVVLVLKRLSDARQEDDTVFTVLTDVVATNCASDGLFSVANAALALHHRAVPRRGRHAVPALGASDAHVAGVVLTAADTAGWSPQPPVALHCYSGADVNEVLRACDRGEESADGPACLVITAATRWQLEQRIATARRWLAGDGDRPLGVTFRSTPMSGEVAFVFTNGAAAYEGMGSGLMLAFPAALAEVENRCGPLRDLVGWAYADDGVAPSAAEQIWGAALLSHVHTVISRDLLGIAPTAALGYSSGETSALTALGAWPDLRELVADMRSSGLFDHELAGELTTIRQTWRQQGIPGDNWSTHVVGASAAEVRTLLVDEPAVYLMAINSPKICVIGGESASCARVLQRFGTGRSVALEYDIAVHAPVLAGIHGRWHKLYHRRTCSVPGVRFYTGATGNWYHPTADAAADAVTALALDTADFVTMVENAWRDGVRVFVEHGPRGLCTGWIRQILGEREHLAISLDGEGSDDVSHLTYVVAELVAAGVRVNHESFTEHLAAIAPSRRAPGWRQVQRLEPAPPLAPAMPSPMANGTHAATAPPTPSALGALAEHHQLTTQMYQRFLTLQTAQHLRFLGAHQRIRDGLLQSSSFVDASAGTRRPTTTPRHRFSADQVSAFAEGRPFDCFGAGWEITKAHVRTPRISSERELLFDEVTEYSSTGGPRGLGYLRARRTMRPGDQQFAGRSAHDLRSPDDLMVNGVLQVLAFYLTAAGYTTDRDGWLFEPLPGRSVGCDGVWTPSSRELTYEVSVIELTPGPLPTLIADVLCSVDGARVTCVRGAGVRLVPAWPWDPAQHEGPSERPVFEFGGVPQNETALLASALGRPSRAFGPSFAVFDSHRRAPRLPGPPFHFVSRIVAVSGEPLAMAVGSAVEAEYDIPYDAWYFTENKAPAMPLAVLMEIALQPCGWLATYAGSTLRTETDLFFRNLDGNAVVSGVVTPTSKLIRTRAVLRSVAEHAGTIIESFEVYCTAGDEVVFSTTSTFGFFTAAAMANQPGILATAHMTELLRRQADPLADLGICSARFPELAGPMLLVLDEVTGWWPDGGPAKLGVLRATKTVDADAWYFKAHFFQDPVQPGSLGVEALSQLLRLYLIESGLTAGMHAPRFEPARLGDELTWKYRGQVVPTDLVITATLEVLEAGADNRGRYAAAQGWLWVDGRCIYHLPRISLRVVETVVVDVATDTWLADHCPTWTVPAMPLMSTVDRLAAAAPVGETITGLRDVAVRRWLPVPEPVRWSVQVADDDHHSVSLLTGDELREVVATGTLLTGSYPVDRPTPFAPLDDAVPVPSPYESGALFHGPAFHYLTEMRVGASGSFGVLDAARGHVPRGVLHQGLLDASVQVIPHKSMHHFDPTMPAGHVVFPHRLARMDLYEALPASGEVEVEARYRGCGDRGPRFPAFDVQMLLCGRVIAEYTLVLVSLPLGPFADIDSLALRAFLRDKQYVDGFGLSSTNDSEGVTELSLATIAKCDWFPGMIDVPYGLPRGLPPADRLAHVAVRDHIARLTKVHPSVVDVADDPSTASVRGQRYSVVVEHHRGRVVVRTPIPYELNGGTP